MALIRYMTWAKRLSIFLVLLFISLYLLAWIFEDKLGKMALALVREEITTEVQVGDFHLSFIRAFPRIRGAFRQVYVQGSDGDTLMLCQTLGLHMGWSTLWSEEVSLDALIIEEGRLNIHLDKKGKGNYDIFKPSADEEDSAIRLNLRKAHIQDLRVHFQDDQGDILVDYQIDDALVKGKWLSNTIKLEEELEGTLVMLKSGKDTLIADLPLNAYGPLQINLKTNSYDLAGTELQLDEVRSTLKGKWELDEKGTWLDLTLLSKDQHMAGLWSLVTKQVALSGEPLNLSGQADLEIQVKGMVKGNTYPEFTASLDWSEGQIKRGGGQLDDIRLQVDWSQPAGRQSDNAVVTIRSMDASYAGEPLHVAGTIRQMKDPIVDLKAHGSIPMALLQTEWVSGKEGVIRFHDVVIQGKLSRNDLQASGRAMLEEILLTYQEDEIRIPSGSLQLQQDELGVRQLHVVLAKNALVLDGDVQGFLAQFRDQVAPVAIRFDGQVQSDRLDAFALMEQFQKWQQNQPASRPSAHSDTPSPAFTRYNGTLHARIGQFVWQDIEGRDFTGSVALDGRTMLISGDAAAMGGTLNLEGELNWGQKTVWEGALTCEEVEVEEAFRQCHNFGQTFITGQQIKGSLSTQLLFSAEWDGQGKFIPEALHVYSAIQIEDGELKGLDVLESFSDFIHVKDLKHVRFSTLQNYLEVIDGMVYLPKMTIESNALVLDVTGFHGFNQNIDYGLRVDAGQVLINKITRHDASLTPKPARQNGWFNLYYHLTGNVDNYTYKSDRERVREDFARSQFHRKRIRAVLESEFGRILFEDEPEAEAPVAERPFQTGIGTSVQQALRPREGGIQPRLTKPDHRPSPTKESEYLEDFEIEGGGAKKKRD